MYVQLQHNYRDNYFTGKINNFISWNGSVLKEGNVYVGLADLNLLKVN